MGIKKRRYRPFEKTNRNLQIYRDYMSNPDVTQKALALKYELSQKVICIIIQRTQRRIDEARESVSTM